MTFKPEMIKRMKNIHKVHFIGQQNSCKRYWDAYCLVIQTETEILLNMKDGVYQSLTSDGPMVKLLMLCGFNNTFYCI